MNHSSKSRLTALAFLACAIAAGAQQPQFEAPPKPAPGRSAVPAKALPGATLLAELRKGGYVIYFRHTSTDFSRDDVRSRSDDDCDNQRPLTDKGRAEAREIGAAFRELKIPVERVLASPRCRTMETAMLAFGKAERENAARGGPASPAGEDRYAPLRTLFTTPLKPGANVVIASHGNPFIAVAGAPYLAEGEAAVIKPLEKDFEIVARVRHDGWRALAR
ncbi:MAG TPA: histidine phosphatase family protein [Burkholderiales bacterium]|jgi:hypothetical protein|nr:histidine phosphatase family protein [Burkholderiales bacterium]